MRSSCSSLISKVRSTLPGTTLVELGNTRTLPTVATRQHPCSAAIRLTASMNSAAATIASLRDSIPVVPEWFAVPETITSVC